MLASQKISVSASEASSTRESKINITVCSFLSGFFSVLCPFAVSLQTVTIQQFKEQFLIVP